MAKANASVKEGKKNARKITKENSDILYSLEELAGAASKFGTSYEIVYAALRSNGLREASISRTRELVDQLIKRDVR